MRFLESRKLYGGRRVATDRAIAQALKEDSEKVPGVTRAWSRMRRRARAELYRSRRRAPEVDLERSFASTTGIVLF